MPGALGLGLVPTVIPRLVGSQRGGHSHVTWRPMHCPRPCCLSSRAAVTLRRVDPPRTVSSTSHARGGKLRAREIQGLAECDTAVKTGGSVIHSETFIVCLLCAGAENRLTPSPAPRRKRLKKQANPAERTVPAVVRAPARAPQGGGWATPGPLSGAVVT